MREWINQKNLEKNSNGFFWTLSNYLDEIGSFQNYPKTVTP